MTSSPQQANWLSYFTGNTLLDVEEQPNGQLFWCNQQIGAVDQTDSSVGFGAVGWELGKVPSPCAELSTKVHTQSCPEDEDFGHFGEEKDVENVETTSVSKKRAREDCGRDKDRLGLFNKAYREKERRDRLNDRFMELSSVLDPSRPPKADKASILSDAVRIIGQLRGEAKHLKEANEQLKEQIKELKTEKSDLREEKSRLKTEKERLEQQVKSLSAPSGYMPHPAAVQVAAAAYAASTAKQAQHHANKLGSTLHHPLLPPGMAMWQWLPAGTMDTSQDHVLRPPVA